MGKYIIPIVIIILLLIWLGFYGFGLLMIPGGMGWLTALKIGGLLVIMLLMGMAVRVLWERIREIKEEDEDDYRQY
jgi:hypothetical protein